MAQGHSHDRASDEHDHHEGSDVSTGPVFKFLAYLALFAAIVHGLIWLMMGYFQSQTAEAQRVQYPMAIGQEREPPAPRLQVEPRLEYHDYETRERDRLEHYRWLDKAAGTVRVPIDKAMQRVVQEGIPTRPAEGSGTTP
jgi:hypothetical protein